MEDVQTAGNNYGTEYIPGVTTWNGAATYGTMNDPLVELFFKSVRDVPATDYRSIPVKQSKKTRRFSASNKNPHGNKSIEEYFDASWKVDPIRTLKFIFHLRDCREGKGERKLFRALVRHMRETGLEEHLEKNLEHIPTFGTWKDLSLCFFGTILESQAVSLISKQLKADKESKSPSLCGKFAPREKGPFDRKHKAAAKIADELGVSLTQYRKQYLTPLKSKLRLVERDMCAKAYKNIEYSHVPSIAGMNYKEAFKRNDGERYGEYLKSVQKGEKKMNTGVLMPYQIVSPYLKQSDIDPTIEAQWKSFVDGRREKWPKDLDIMPLVDVSASMEGGSDPKPLHVAVALGMLFSQLNVSDRFKGKFITFHESPELLTIPEGSLHDQVTYMHKSKWGGSTNIQKAFDLMLDTAKMYDVPADKMPKVLMILSDMQFNQADGGKTNWKVIDEKYKNAGYKRPIIFFWNLNGTTMDFPVPDSKIKDIVLMSGFNDSVLYSILDGEMPDPRTVVRKILDAERYNIIQLA